MRADAAGEDARELVRVAEAFREAEEPELASRAFWRAVHVYRRRDEHTKGLAVLKRIVALSPNEPAARTAIGECLERLERRAEAADHFRHAALLAAQAQRPNAAKQLYARADRLCPRGPRKMARGASVLAEDLQLPTAAQPRRENRDPAAQVSLRDDRAPGAQPSLRDDRLPAAQPNHDRRAPAAQVSLRDDRAPGAQPSLRDDRAPGAQPNLRDDRAPSAQPNRQHRGPAAQPHRQHRAATAQPSLRDDRAPAPRSAPVAPPSSRGPVARTPPVIPPATPPVIPPPTPPPAPRRVVTTARDSSAPELPELARWPSVPRPRAATPRLEYAAPEPDPAVARPRRRAEALFRSEETASVHGTGTELALDAEALLLDDDPAEAATAKTAPRSPLDVVKAPVVFDAPTTNYAPMMLEDLLQSEEETVTTAPIDPLRCAS